MNRQTLIERLYDEPCIKKSFTIVANEISYARFEREKKNFYPDRINTKLYPFCHPNIHSLPKIFVRKQVLMLQLPWTSDENHLFRLCNRLVMTLFVIRNVWCLFSMDINNAWYSICVLCIYKGSSWIDYIFQIIYIAYLGAFLFVVFLFFLLLLSPSFAKYLYFIKWKRIRILRDARTCVTWVGT